jgi:hypothetical protein
MSLFVDGNGKCLSTAIINCVYDSHVELIRMLRQVMGCGHAISVSIAFMASSFSLPSSTSTNNQHPLATIIGLPFSVLRHKCGAVVLDISVEGRLRHGHKPKYQPNIQRLLEMINSILS